MQRPEVLQGGYLADLTVKEQAFVFFLPKMCVPGPQQVLFRALTEGAYTARKQLKVMGYSIEDEVSLLNAEAVLLIILVANNVILQSQR